MTENFEFNVTISCPETLADAELIIPVQPYLEYEIGTTGLLIVNLSHIQLEPAVCFKVSTYEIEQNSGMPVEFATVEDDRLAI